MALNSVSSEEFSFPMIASQDSSQFSGIDSPPLWKHSPDNFLREDHDRGFGRLLIGKYDNNDQTKSFSYVETRSLWSDKAEEKMDMLWEDLNEELPPRSQSLRIDTGGDGGEKKSSLFSDESSAVAVGCGMKLTKKTPPKKKMSPNVLVLMRVLKKLLLLRTSSQRSPAKTHPR
ncbi:hypothetical protein EUTSA_v10019217mg [Eutrema salsugineum]|uniref:Uncharacterized protein n=1 Tax=Eutrema salsugineum TaxID=72664 RepID=V4KAD8_EUTSA|nr:uncharacterized protein LOC18009265 [Eutrema salsugineum]ESQ28014.1 hypothetical protein EUTSA_v10019217mg [Eutrema salsugineum]